MPDSAKPYTTWETDCTLFDSDNKPITRFKALQHLYIGKDEFIVRLGRDLDGQEACYEDRGALDETGRITGKTGYGGELSGQIFTEGFGNELQGTGGDVDFTLGAIVVSETQNRCFRILDARKATRIFGTPVEPGRYYTTSTDRFLSGADDLPEELRAPLDQ